MKPELQKGNKETKLEYIFVLLASVISKGVPFYLIANYQVVTIFLPYYKQKFLKQLK
jgi:hypothetical protein